MKNKIGCIVIVILPYLFLSSLSAQIGIKGVVGVSDIAFLKMGQTPYLGYEINSLEHRKPLVAYQLGVFSTFALGKRIELQPELLFTAQGLDYSTAYLYDDITYKISINYLTLPILLKYLFHTGRKTDSALLIGPYASWKLKAVRITKIEGEREKETISNVKNYDFGALVGYSFGIKLPSGKMTFGLRASYGLLNMMDPISGHIPNYNGPTKKYARNVLIALSIGYQYNNLFSKKADNI